MQKNTCKTLCQLSIQFQNEYLLAYRLKIKHCPHNQIIVHKKKINNNIIINQHKPILEK